VKKSAREREATAEHTGGEDTELLGSGSLPSEIAGMASAIARQIFAESVGYSFRSFSFLASQAKIAKLLKML
jgi:hypothetical protein